jgi:glycosyltransferase involved in cell wall biosynthesis
MGDRKKQKLCIITYPFPKVEKMYSHLFTFVKIIEPLFESIHIITGNIPENETPPGKFQLINFRMEVELRRHLPKFVALPIWLFNFALGQTKTLYYLTKVSRSTDTVLFFLGADINLLSLLLAKLLKKEVITMIVEYSPMSIESAHGRTPAYLYKLLAKLNRTLSDKIIVYTRSVIQWAHLEKYQHKISVGSEVFIDTNLFRINQPYSKRKNTIGYIGRASKEKGILDFVNAIPLILHHRSDVDFLIVGDGPLLSPIKQELRNNGLLEKVALTGWITHDEMPDYMNRLKLLVMPTHTEAGSPQPLQEAMSCGTPVLVTMVGGVGDVVKDGENGFILRNRSPQQIAKDVLKILEYPQINEIIRNGQKLIEQDYTFKAVAKRYKAVFEQQ